MFFFLLIGEVACAQGSDKTKHWKVELAGALNNYTAWEIEPFITYHPIRYIGLSMGLLFSNPLENNDFNGQSIDKQWLWNSADNNSGSHFFAFRPAIQLVSPSVWLGENKDYQLYFSVSPGLTIPLPTNKEFDIEYIPNRPGTWTIYKTEHVENYSAPGLFYHFKSAFSLEIDNSITFSLGYTFSNFDLYSGSRNIVVEGEKLSPEKHHFMHSFSIGIGVWF